MSFYFYIYLFYRIVYSLFTFFILFYFINFPYKHYIVPLSSSFLIYTISLCDLMLFCKYKPFLSK
ncbi:hypothetical protein BC941DRAFT_436078 [Chlamydoabsidia padenii]|nr:hypothetical protein BC941DRAFT_436078 [Chlamydoabsidia padenii]